MKKYLPLAFLLTGFFMLTDTAHSQQTDRFAYAITDAAAGTFNWSQLRKLNLQTGEYSDVLLNGNDISYRGYDAATKKQFENSVTDPRFGQTANAAFGTGVASLAFDKKNNRLYYTPMFIDQLRYIDLRSMKVFYVTGQAFSGQADKAPDQSNIITRMAIASDGNGYAMSNDGQQLVQFSTGKKLKVVNLGQVIDDPANKDISIHNSCSSFGGDMVADDAGNLYVFSARNHVFKINIENKIATYLGAVSGLPQNFTINGAAVDEKNKIVVATASLAASYYTVDFPSLNATPYLIKGNVLNSSDLANSNLLVTAAKNKNPINELIANKQLGDNGQGKTTIFPNPVTGDQFLVRFNGVEAGNYNVQITDVMGKQVKQQAVTVGGENQVQLIKMDPASSKGIYFVKITDSNSRIFYSTKFVLQ